MLRKNIIGNNEYLYGDYDNDRIKNIDDKDPFNSNIKERINPELRLSDELKHFENQYRKNERHIKRFAKKINADEYRVKSPISLIRKLRLKYSDLVTDSLGTRIIVRNRAEVHRTARELYQKYRVISEKNFYNANERGSKIGYRARHLIIQEGGEKFEVQIISAPFAELAKTGHLAYKLNDREKIQKNELMAQRLVRQGY